MDRVADAADAAAGADAAAAEPALRRARPDSDGEISTAELRKAVASLKKLDRDEDNVITREEAGVGGRGGRGGGDPAQMVDRWMENDANGDGKLSEDEVPEFMAQMIDRRPTPTATATLTATS